MPFKALILGTIGAAALVLLLVLWTGLAEQMISLVETAWCRNSETPGDCHLRGAYAFLIGAVFFLVTLILAGLLNERFTDRR